MRDITKRIISFVIIFTMLVGIVPETALTAFAEEHVNQVRVIVENTTYSVEDGAAWEGRLVDEWVDINEDSTAMSALITALDKNSYYSEGAESNYITNINDLGAGMYNGMDGWMFMLNDWFTDNGAGYYTVADGTLCAGDEIYFAYSLNMGEDLGGTYYNNDTSLEEVAFSTGEITKAEIDISNFTNNGEHQNAQYHFILTVPTDTTGIVVTPTARNKNFQVRTYLNYVDTTSAGYKRSETIPVSAGDAIYVICGDPSWPSMNTNAWGNGAACYPTQYVFQIAYASGEDGSQGDTQPVNNAPTLSAEYETGTGTENIYVGEEYTLDLSKVFTDIDNDTLTYTVSINGSNAETLSDSNYIYRDTASAKNVSLVFSASDGEESVSYTLTLNVEKKVATLNSLIIHSSTTPNDSNVLLKNAGDSYTTDLETDEDVKIIIYVLAESVAARLRENGFRCRTVEISIRDKELYSFTRQRKVSNATNITREIAEAAFALFKDNYDFRRQRPIRSLGVRGADLVTDDYWEQMDLFEDPQIREKYKKADAAVDEIRKRFGYYSIQRGLMYQDEVLSHLNAKEDHTVHPHGYFG